MNEMIQEPSGFWGLGLCFSVIWKGLGFLWMGFSGFWGVGLRVSGRRGLGLKSCINPKLNPKHLTPTPTPYLEAHTLPLF